MHPPFGFALFYLRGIAPSSVRSRDIYWGAIPWVVLQLMLVGILIAFPEIVTAFLDKELVVDPNFQVIVPESAPSLDLNGAPPIDLNTPPPIN
jgi:NhaP-type Na+/H+ or K+/H+ antiporter